MSDILSEDEIASIISLNKFMNGDLDWEEKPNHSAYLEVSRTLTDENGATIPGLTVSLRYRIGRIVEDCKYDFTIFTFHKNKRRRAYQLDIRPENVSCHTGSDGIWYGPHQHFGERAAQIEYDKTWGCPDHEKWFRLFLLNAGIQYGGKYYHPEIQMELIPK